MDNKKYKSKIGFRKACMVAYTFYESDNRVRRYAETLQRNGVCVDVIALRKQGESSFNMLNGINVYRIQERVINEKGKFSYLWRILKFLFNSALFLTMKTIRDPYDLIHVHSVPDFEVFAALIPKMFGSKIILDIHDIVPEFYASKFRVSHESLIYKMLLWMEKLSISFSNHVIIANHIWEKKLLSRSVSKEKGTTILNFPDNFIFYRRAKNRKDNKFILLYPGTINWHQGLDIAVKAIKEIKNDVPELEFHIYGEGPEKSDLSDMIQTYGLADRIFLKSPVPISEISQIMSNADLGIIPKRNDGFGGEAFSTKSLEFMSLGIPIIISKTKIDHYYFNDTIVTFFEPENVNDLADKILLLYKDKGYREKLRAQALDFAQKFQWENNQNIYFDILNSLFDKRAH